MKQQLVIATANRHKLIEIRQILNGIGFEMLSLADFPEIPPIRETGDTFLANALLKARTVHTRTRLPVLADDSGLEVDALDGAPGIYSARYCGREHDYPANNRKLLDALKNIPDDRRGAQFRCVVVLVGNGIEDSVEGIARGRIIRELRGEGGFGYDPLFIPEGYEQTFAELGETMKNQISHRARAFLQARQLLEKYFG